MAKEFFTNYGLVIGAGALVLALVVGGGIVLVKMIAGARKENAERKAARLVQIESAREAIEGYIETLPSEEAIANGSHDKYLEDFVAEFMLINSGDFAALSARHKELSDIEGLSAIAADVYNDPSLSKLRDRISERFQAIEIQRVVVVLQGFQREVAEALERVASADQLEDGLDQFMTTMTDHVTRKPKNMSDDIWTSSAVVANRQALSLEVNRLYAAVQDKRSETENAEAAEVVGTLSNYATTMIEELNGLEAAKSKPATEDWVLEQKELIANDMIATIENNSSGVSSNIWNNGKVQVARYLVLFHAQALKKAVADRRQEISREAQVEQPFDYIGDDLATIVIGGVDYVFEQEPIVLSDALKAKLIDAIRAEPADHAEFSSPDDIDFVYFWEKKGNDIQVSRRPFMSVQETPKKVFTLRARSEQRDAPARSEMRDIDKLFAAADASRAMQLETIKAGLSAGDDLEKANRIFGAIDGIDSRIAAFANEGVAGAPIIRVMTAESIKKLTLEQLKELLAGDESVVGAQYFLLGADDALKGLVTAALDQVVGVGDYKLSLSDVEAKAALKDTVAMRYKNVTALAQNNMISSFGLMAPNVVLFDDQGEIDIVSGRQETIDFAAELADKLEALQAFSQSA